MVASPSQGSFGNEEDVWFGGDDREAESRAEQSVAAVGARIIGAKPFPIAARRLEELTRNPKARLEQVVSVLETDPGLSVRLLRLVNSAGYGLKVRVTSVRHAAVLVGTRRLHQVATTAAILDLFETNNETAVLLLEHASVVGSLCRYLAVHLGLPHDELFTCGFLHDIGKLMLLDTEGDKYADLVRSYSDAPDQMHIHERRMFGFDHAVLGAHVLTAWNIPEPVPKVVLYHHQPARAMQDTLLSSMVHTLRLADLLSYAVVRHEDAVGIALVTESEAAQYLDISEPQMAAMWSDLKALADRSRARSHGQADLEVVAPRRLEVPRSLRPRRSAAPRSMPPSGSMPIALGDSSPSSPRTGPNSDVPVHFPCVACNKPSFGNLCAACAGQVCPEHQVGPDHWCVLCLREYEKFRDENALPVYLKVTGLALAGFSVGASITGVMVSQTFAIWKLIVAPLTMLLLWGVLLPVAHRLWQRKRFVNSRPKGRVPLPIKLPRPNPVFISSLDANLENEGLMGPSIPPPSQAGLAIVAPSATVAVSAGQVVITTMPELPLPPTQSSIVVAPVVAPEVEVLESQPTDPARSAAAPEAPKAAATELPPEEAPPPSEKELDAAAHAFEASSELSKVQPSLPPELAIGPLLGAAASLNPLSGPPPVMSVVPVPAPAAKDSVAAHIASLLGEPTEGLSEFPSVESETELENVVASVSARLAREFPQNDYMGPSAGMRAATIAPISESESEAPAAPAVEKSASPVEAPLAAESNPEPVATPELAATAEPVVTPEPAVSAEPALVPEPEPEPTRVAEASPAMIALAAPAAELATMQLVFSRKSLEQGCAPRTVFRCAIPVAESCSPAPRRTSLRPGAEPVFAAGESTPPGTLRGLG